jgi:hypothetical protein
MAWQPVEVASLLERGRCPHHAAAVAAPHDVLLAVRVRVTRGQPRWRQFARPARPDETC